MVGKKATDVIVAGLALFAIFFGAGNLIFPPSLGLKYGNAWIVCFLGFFLTGICLPLLGVITSAKAGGKLSNITDKISPSFTKILGTLIVLCIGPLFCIPRTGATTYELGVQNLFPSANMYIVIIVYFLITLFFAINPSNIVDNLGKILTPLLVITLSFIIIKGIVSPIGTPLDFSGGKVFSGGFMEGYQTMDALGSVLTGSIVVTSFIAKGYSDKKEVLKLSSYACVISAVGLTIVYGGLMYLGSSASTQFAQDIPKTNLLINIINNLLGSSGKVAMSIIVTLSCLTTSIGLTCMCAKFLNEVTNDKLSYKLIVSLVCLVSAILSGFGVEAIINLAVPVLQILYPVMIILIVCEIFDNIISISSYKGAVYTALIVSLIDVLFNKIIDLNFIPFSENGFAWLIPAIIVGLIIAMIKKKSTTDI